MSNQKKHLEEVSQKYPVKSKQKKVVENNVTENRFSAIKRSVKKPKEIDEKIEYLEKECQKTGLNEITMSTIGVYQKPTPVPNQDYNDFESQSQGGYGLGFSGADGNGAGGGIIGTDGVAYSPPHPVTGVRRAASHVRDGLGGRQALRPGAVIKRGFADNAPDYTMGSALWFYDSSYNNGEGQWCNLEWGNFVGATGWGFWDTIKTGQFAGMYKFETDLSLHPCGDISGKIGGINFGTNGSLGPPQTIVLFKSDLGDPSNIPIDINGMSPEAFEYLKGRATASSGANYDLFNYIDKVYGIEAANWYEKNPTLPHQSNPFIPPAAAPYVPLASKGKDPDIAANYNDFVDPLDRMIKKLEKRNKQLPWPKPDPDDPFKFSQGHTTSSYEPEGDLLSEAVKLGYFDPEVLNVDIEDLRKGIMPEFPKDPPPEMINGYSAKSRLAPKKAELPPFIKITKKDLTQNHKLTDKEIQNFLEEIQIINDYIKKNPAELIYALTRYPKNDPRLAQINFKLDRMKEASDKYIDKQFPENKKLFNKLQDKIKQNIELTDPKNFTDHKRVPTFIDTMKEQKKIREKKKNRKWIKAMSRNK